MKISTIDHDGQWQAILRAAGAALRGLRVQVWEADVAGSLRLLAADREADSGPDGIPGLETTLSAIGELPVRDGMNRRWVVAGQADGRRWIARVRCETWRPPPGLERRSPERCALDLAAFCIGILDAWAYMPYAAMVQSSEDAIIGKTLDGIITSWNAGAERLYGYTPGEIIGKPITMLAPPDREDEIPEILRRLRRGERVEQLETVRVRKDGGLVDVSVSISPILDPSSRPVGATSIARDISARKDFERRLLHEALHDALTDLPNRSYFVERASEALQRARRDREYRFAVLFLDFDGFKRVNDTLGHAVGDRFLREVATRLRQCVRPDDVVARLGGDEFTLLVDGIGGPGDVERAIAHIQQALSLPVTVDGRDIPASASIGAALSEERYHDAEDLLRDADLAMYHAKQERRGAYRIFDLAMRQSTEARRVMEEDLEHALAREQLRLVFQPIVELESGRVYAFEALLRWHHPDLGTIAPVEFVPLAEKTGAIVPIGSWVLRESCRLARSWQERFPDVAPVRVSVNLSPTQLGHSGIVHDVRTALGASDLAPSLLVVELTETMLTESTDTSAGILRELRRLGIDVYMDDFGTGHSSLSRLAGFQLQGLKVHHSFIHRMGARRRDLAIVRSIVDLAGTLGLRVVAEGVETIAQRERLIAFGCELGQGHLFGGPLEPETATLMLADSSPSAHASA